MNSSTKLSTHELPEDEIRELLLRYRRENWEGIQPPDIQEKVVDDLIRCDPDVVLNAIKAYVRITPHSRILDLGSGVGSFVSACRKRGLDCYGIEPDRIGGGSKLTAIQIAARRVTKTVFAVGVGEHLPFADRTFDLVTMNQVIEHVEDQRAVLFEAARVLKDQGALYIACPNYLRFYEPHYKIFWLPLMPKMLGKIYLTLRGRRSMMIDQITYTTNARLQRLLSGLGPGYMVVDLHRQQFLNKRKTNSFAATSTHLVSRLSFLPVVGPVILRCVLWFASIHEGGCEWLVVRTAAREK